MQWFHFILHFTHKFCSFTTYLLPPISLTKDTLHLLRSGNFLKSIQE